MVEIGFRKVLQGEKVYALSFTKLPPELPIGKTYTIRVVQLIDDEEGEAATLDFPLQLDAEFAQVEYALNVKYRIVLPGGFERTVEFVSLT